MKRLGGLTIAIALVVVGCGADGAETADGGGGGTDATAMVDAAVVVVDAMPGTPCSVGGVAGECRDVADCTGDHMATPGLCPGPANIQCCTPTGTTGMCDPLAMPRPNDGLTTEAPGTGGCPAGMARVDTYCVDVYEGSLVELAADGSAIGTWSPFWNPGTARVRAVSVAGAVPQGYINEPEAAGACAEAGKRMCTDAEWLRACRGPAGTTYPYGDTRLPGVCNDARAQHPAIEYFMTTDSWIWSMLGHPCLNQLPASLAAAGANGGCVTAEGLFDMMGNLHEWTADPAGTFRGGFYVDTMLNGPGCLYATTAHDVSHWDYSTGFRCCADLP